MSNEVNEYLTLDHLQSGVVISKNETVTKNKEDDIATLEHVKERLEDSTQKSVMEKIINSAKNDTAEVPRVINLVEVPETSKEAKQDMDIDKDGTAVQMADVDIIESKSRFIRKKIDFNTLDALYLEEALRFVQQYKESHLTEEEDIPKRLAESYVEEILSTPIRSMEKQEVVCAVPYLEIPVLGLPADKVLTAMEEEIEEDVLFSFITMNPYDSEVGDFVYNEDALGAINSEYPILM